MDNFDFKKIKFLKKKQSLNDVLGVHLTTDVVAFLRVKKVAGLVSITDAEIFDYSFIVKEKGDCINGRIPAYMKSKYAAVAYASEKSLIKLLTFPRLVESRSDKQIAADLGVTDDVDEYRLGHASVGSEGKSESSIIEIALPVSEVNMVNGYFSQHMPAVSNIGISHLGLMNAYAASLHGKTSSGVVAVLNLEPTNTGLFVFNDSKLIFFRMFRTGMDFFTEEIARLMGISTATVSGIICENAFDVSQQVNETLKTFAHQANLCLDFVERKEGVVIRDIKLAGCAETIAEFVGEFQNFFIPEVSMFDPFESFDVLDGAFRNFDKKRWRYATALGVALGLLGGE